MNSMLIVKRWYGLLMVLVLLSSVTTVRSQSIKSVDSLANATSWIDKASVKELKAIIEGYEIKVKHRRSIAQRDSLKYELEISDSIKNALSSRQREIQKVLSTIFDRGDKPELEQKYLKCDTITLLRNQGLYGDSIVECMQEAMFAYHRAEGALLVRYDIENVQKARRTLELAKSFFPIEYTELDRRIEQYGALTDSLRHALIIADTLDKLNSTEELSSSSTERYTRRFFDKLAENVNPLLLSTSEYPYLYGILTKAMAIIMDDPRKSIAELIDEL